MSGSSAQFEPVAQACPGLEVYAIDLRGQGNDPVASRRGMLLDVASQHRDIATVLAQIKARHSGRPVFLMGESMGSLLAASFTGANVDHGVDALVLSVPVVRLKRRVPPALAQAVRLIARVAPRLRCRPSLFVNGRTLSPPLTRDTAYQDSMRTKPHYIRDFTFRFLSELGALIESSHDTAPRLRTPTLVLAAGNDCFVEAEEIRAWHDKIAAPDKTLRIYPDAYHLLWYDWDREEVLADVRRWIEERTGQCG